ncbi:RNA-binding protein lark isoform X2 [Aplysia californica]|uniref:RNA-binding protein lark isoform X2 n=1 Tax=Aplysia californica TaxID=6500 RepID=A0ABM1A552_APLCA|nr:RNA-binding protein lark isoform X2 [Aplysia californica]
MVGTKLYVGNLPDEVNKDELEQMFRKYGNVVEFDILKDYGFVHYEQESEAKAAAAALDGHVYRGTNMKVEVSRSKVRQKAGMGGKGECYRCGGEGHWSKECPRGPSRDSSRGRGMGMRGGGGRFRVYDRPPPREAYYPDPYDYYARSRMYPPSSSYDRYRYDPYERRLPPVPPPRDPYRDPYARPSPEYYRRSPPRDPYYDYYERRSLSSSGAASAVDDIKPPPRNPLQGRVPGPY